MGNLGLWGGVGGKSEESGGIGSMEIGAFGRVAVNPAYVKVGTFGGVGGTSEKSGSICSM